MSGAICGIRQLVSVHLSCLLLLGESFLVLLFFLDLEILTSQALNDRDFMQLISLTGELLCAG